MRNRTIIRAGFMILLGLAALALLTNSALTGYGRNRLADAQARYEKEIGSLNLRTLMLPPVPDEENATTWLTAGAQALVLFDDEKRTIGRLAERPESGWSAEEISS